VLPSVKTEEQTAGSRSRESRPRDPKTARKAGLRSGRRQATRKWIELADPADPFAEVWEEIQGLREQPGLGGEDDIRVIATPGVLANFRGTAADAAKAASTGRGNGSDRAKKCFLANAMYLAVVCFQSDFTHMTSLGITWGVGEVSRIFVGITSAVVLELGNSTICHSESSRALSDGLQNALCKLGGAPIQHQTDRMSTAVNSHER